MEYDRVVRTTAWSPGPGCHGGCGGFVLRNGAALDDAKAENLRAMIETGRAWQG
jgi:hypothetical protein